MGRLRVRFFCIAREDTEATNALLEDACARRKIPFVFVDPDTFRYDGDMPGPGDLLYKVTTDLASGRIESFLLRPEVASFYKTPHLECFSQSVTMMAAGVPMPKAVHSLTRDRETLAHHVDYLGGFPVVAKVPGGEGGAGVLRADSMPALFSLADYVSDAATLMEYFEHAVAYRLVVVGDAVVATEARYPGPGEFRTNTGNSGTLGRIDPPKEARRIALMAADVLGLEFGGADVLENEAGRMVLTEFNMPCYFADQQNDHGIDIAGAMVDFLVAKSKRLAAA